MSDDIYEWLNSSYEKTDNKKDTIKVKEIYQRYKASEYFINLTKAEKRNNNYKQFITQKLEGNYFVKKYLKEDSSQTTVLTNYKMKEDDEDGDEDGSTSNYKSDFSRKFF